MLFMKYNIWIFIAIIMILCFNVNGFPSSSAYKWAGMSNANQYLSYGGSWFGFSSNTPNVGGPVYSLCNLPIGSDCPPIVGSFYNSSSLSIVIKNSNENSFSLYDMNCNELDTIYPPNYIYTCPVMTDITSQLTPEIAFGGLQNITIYRYNESNNTFQIILSINTTLTPGTLAAIDYQMPVGYAYGYGSLNYRTITYTQFGTSTIGRVLIENINAWQSGGMTAKIYNSNTLTANMLAESLNSDFMMRGTVSDYNPNNLEIIYTYYIPICNFNSLNNAYTTCSIIATDQNNFSSVTISNFTVSAGVIRTGLNSSSCFIAEVDSTFKVLCSIRSTPISDNHQFMIDINGVTKVNYYSASSTGSGNWIVSAFDYGSNNLACMNDQQYSKLLCYNSGGILRYNLSYDPWLSTYLHTSHIAAGQFTDTDNSSYMQLVTYAGIFLYNGSSFEPFFLSNYTSSSGWPVVLPGETNNNIVVYVDAEGGYIIKDAATYIYCGDMACDINFENAFTCPEDCNQEVYENADCIFDSQCPDNYPHCLLQKCVRGYDANETCADVSDCPYGKPICYYGYCIESVQGGLINTTVNYTTTITTPDSGNDMMNIWTSLFGNDSSMKLFIGLLFIMIVVIYAHMYTGSVLIDIMVFICSMTIMTFTRLSLIAVNIYILIMIFMAFVIFILYITMRKTGAEG